MGVVVGVGLEDVVVGWGVGVGVGGGGGGVGERISSHFLTLRSAHLE